MKKNKYLFGIILLGIIFVLCEITKYDEIIKIENDYVFGNEIEVIETYKEEIEKLRKENNNDDIVGTIEILNTNFKAPILQGRDNDYYLRRLPNKQYNINGSIFLDYRVNINTSKKLLIYGHNDANLKMPFEILEEYYDIEFLKNHKIIEIKTYENKIRKYELFSIFIEPSDFSYMQINYNDEEYLNHLINLKNKSMYKIESNIDKNTNILILQTCSTHKDYAKYNKKYLLLVFKEI